MLLLLLVVLKLLPNLMMMLLLKLLLKLLYNICRVPGFKPEILRPSPLVGISSAILEQ